MYELKWISVKDALPDEDFETIYLRDEEYPSYLITMEYGSIPAIANFDGSKWVFSHDEFYRIGKVIAWAELPPVYEGE